VEVGDGELPNEREAGWSHGAMEHNGKDGIRGGECNGGL